MNQLKESSILSSRRRCFATSVPIDSTPIRNLLTAVRNKMESAAGLMPAPRLNCKGAGLVALALLAMPPEGLRAAQPERSPLAATSPAEAVHPYEYCRFLTNGRVRNCEYSSMAQCKASSKQCERYPFLEYCLITPSGQAQRCDFDTMAECQATTSGLAGSCQRSPYLKSPEVPRATVLKSPEVPRATAKSGNSPTRKVARAASHACHPASSCHGSARMSPASGRVFTSANF